MKVYWVAMKYSLFIAFELERQLYMYPQGGTYIVLLHYDRSENVLL